MFFMEQEIKLLNAKIVFSENVPPSNPNTENESYTQCSSYGTIISKTKKFWSRKKKSNFCYLKNKKNNATFCESNFRNRNCSSLVRTLSPGLWLCPNNILFHIYRSSLI